VFTVWMVHVSSAASQLLSVKELAIIAEELLVVLRYSRPCEYYCKCAASLSHLYIGLIERIVYVSLKLRDKKLSCRREVVRHSVSLENFLSRSRSLELFHSPSSCIISKINKILISG